MKKIYFIYSLLIVIVSSQFVTASTIRSKKNSELVTLDSVEIVTLTNRLEKINELDKSNLSRSEKRVLRKEVSSIKEKLDIVPTGIYISSGALILIVILLIILI